MDTKLRKFNDRLSVRACAFILCILLILISATTVFIGAKKISDETADSAWGANIETIAKNDNYYESEAFAWWASSMFENIATLIKYVSRDNIKTGKLINQVELDERVEVEYDSILIDGRNSKNTAYYNQYSDDPSNANLYYELKPYDEMKVQFAKDYPDVVDKMKREIIALQLDEFDMAKQHLDGLDGIGYSATKGKNNISNNLKESSGLTLRVQNGNVTVIPDNIEFNETEFISGTAYSSVDINDINFATSPYQDSVFSIELPQTLMDQIDIYFNHAKDVFNKYSILAVITFVAALFLFIYLVIVTGRRDEFGQVKLYRSDRLITEVQLLIICSLAVMTVLPVWILIETLGDLSMPTWTDNSYNFALLILGIALQTIILSSLLWFILSVVRMFKAHTFLSRSVMVIAVKTLYKWIRAVFSSMNPMGKFILIIVLGCLLCAIWPLIPVIIVLLLGFGYHWIKKYTAIKKGVEEVTNGNLTYKIPVDNRSNSEFDNLARQINTISQASNIAIQNELKNQRLKTDLISNVSHDLKTPLTSIITYTDLLKKEGLSSPNAENYLKVIDEKGQRLKTLTEDLFEAAKVSSGSIPLRMEKVELLSLIRQGLVELDESLQQKGLEVIINSDNDKYYVNADSQLLWRVVENLLNNISKYALDNSRVYIDLKTREDGNKPTPTILFEMKNMSKAPLNIPEDELMERFKRGDESRGTEGSGLGLAIAKDLVRLQNGWFEIKIDGDLFKSTVLLDAYDEDVARATQVMNDEEDKIKQKMMNQDEGGMPRIIN